MRTFSGVALVGLAAHLGFYLPRLLEGFEGEPEVLLTMPLFVGWGVAPTFGAFCAASASRGTLAGWLFAALAMSFPAATWLSLLTPTASDGQAGIAIGLFMPLFFYAALSLSIGLAYLLGWRPEKG